MLCYFLIESTSNVANAIDWAKRDKEYTERILPILKKYCLKCHSGAEAEGGLALSHFSSTKAILKERRTWEKVFSFWSLGTCPLLFGTVLAVFVCSLGIKGVNVAMSQQDAFAHTCDGQKLAHPLMVKQIISNVRLVGERPV